MPQNPKLLLGAVVAAALAFAVYYGLIGQQAANTIQSQANQSLGTTPASQQPVSPAPQPSTTPTPMPNSVAPQNAPQAPRQ